MNWRVAVTCCSLLWLANAPASAGTFPVAPSIFEGEAPKVQALLDQAWAVESGRGVAKNPLTAAALYRQAGEMGNAEAYFRAARIHIALMARESAVCMLSAASRLGHVAAAEALDRMPPQTHVECDENLALPEHFTFDMSAYVGSLPQERQRVAEVIRRLAPIYRVDIRLALAIAGAESNFNPRALSPKMAMGVMQLIPETAERFNVRNPYDIEQNVRGGLAYLRWLHGYFGGDVMRVIAAYNAGEGAVTQYDGVPPYRETQNYVVRVMRYAGQTPGMARSPSPAVEPRRRTY